MGVRFYDTQKVVEEVLTDYPETRDYDELLQVKVYKKMCPEVSGLSWEAGVLSRKEMGLPSFKTIERTRRKIQENNPLLRASDKVLDMRYEQFKEFREYAKS